MKYGERLRHPAPIRTLWHSPDDPANPFRQSPAAPSTEPAPNRMWTELVRLGVNKRSRLIGPASDRKHVPVSYRLNDVEGRLQLLAGMIDADGRFDVHNNAHTIVQGTARHLKLVRYKASVVRSLGFSCTVIDTGTGGRTFRGVPVFECYASVRLWFHDRDAVPCLSPRKHSRTKKAADKRIITKPIADGTRAIRLCRFPVRRKDEHVASLGRYQENAEKHQHRLSH